MTTLTVNPAASARPNRVLADRFGGTILREVVLVATGTLALILLARVSVPLPFTPVPVFGYVLGYFLVALIAGLSAQRGADRRVVTMVPTALVSLASVYVAGLAWMIPFAHMTLADGLARGLVPFIIGDLLKAAVASGLFPVLRSLTR